MIRFPTVLWLTPFHRPVKQVLLPVLVGAADTLTEAGVADLAYDQLVVYLTYDNGGQSWQIAKACSLPFRWMTKRAETCLLGSVPTKARRLNTLTSQSKNGTSPVGRKK